MESEELGPNLSHRSHLFHGSGNIIYPLQALFFSSSKKDRSCPAYHSVDERMPWKHVKCVMKGDIREKSRGQVRRDLKAVFRSFSLKPKSNRKPLERFLSKEVTQYHFHLQTVTLSAVWSRGWVRAVPETAQYVGLGAGARAVGTKAEAIRKFCVRQRTRHSKTRVFAKPGEVQNLRTGAPLAWQ